jgi:hypothetical protein
MNKQDMIRYIESKIAEYQKQLKLVKTFPDFDGLNIRSFVIVAGGVGLFIPYDLTILRQIRKAMGKGWRLCYTHFDEVNGKYYLAYKGNDDRDLTIHLESDSTTCHRIQTGTKEIPIYDVVCQ